MSTTSQVSLTLGEIEATINNLRGKATAAKATLAAADAQLAALATTHADVIATINGYTPTGTLEEVQKARLADLTTEFQALKAEIAGGVTDLSAYAEY